MPRRDENNPFVIDENDLDGEWIRQAQLTRKAGHAEADAKHDLNLANANMDVTEARLALKIRNDPGKYDLSDKPSIPEVKASVICQPEYQEATNRVIKARYEADIAEADVRAMVDRRKALERLVELLQINYYSEREPQASPEARQQMSERRKKSVRTGSDD